MTTTVDFGPCGVLVEQSTVCRASVQKFTCAKSKLTHWWLVFAFRDAMVKLLFRVMVRVRQNIVLSIRQLITAVALA